MPVKDFPLTSESYEEGRLVEVSPLFFRGTRLARYLEFYLVANFEAINRTEELETLRRCLRKLPENDRSTVAKTPSDLELCFKKIIPLAESYADDPKIEFNEDDCEEFLATARNLLREFIEVKESTDWLKLLLEDHHYAVAGAVHQGLYSTRGIKRWIIDEPSEPFYELARLRDELFEEWTEDGFQIYLMSCDEFMGNEAYDSWRAYAAENAFIPGSKFPSLEDIDRLRNDLEVSQLWQKHTR